MQHPLLALALSTPWALRPDVISASVSILVRRMLEKEGLAAREHDTNGHMARTNAAARAGSGSSRAGAIAIIPIMGTIVQRADQLPLCEGGTTTENVAAALRQAMADSSISQILLHIHSPGGSVFGVQELADEIRAARAQKPIVAIADSMAASAAYWLGCSAGEFYVTPSGQVGSIGVYMAHEDVSQALDKAGVNVTLISSGKFKTEGNPFAPLPDDARAFLQASTDSYYAAFTEAVSKGRNVPISKVRNGMGQGRVLGARAALAEKMVDGVMTFADVVRRMQGAARTGNSGHSGQSNRPRMSAEAMRREIDILSI